MQVVDLKTYKKDLSKLFVDFQWNFIPDAIREGSMGEVLVDDLDNPQVSILRIPEFKVQFLGGDAESPAARDYLNDLPLASMIMYSDKEWPKLLRKIHSKRLVVMPRFAFSSDNLDIDHLKELKGRMPEKFHIKKIDLALAAQVMKMAKEKDRMLMEQLFGFDSPEDFMTRGLGYIAFLDDEMVSIAAAGAACEKGIEVQINTRKEYEGQGLGTAVGAALIIDCLENDIVPNWDAATEISAGLAKKLGYTPKGEYLVYVYLKYKILVNLRTFLRKIRGKGIIEP